MTSARRLRRLGILVALGASASAIGVACGNGSSSSAASPDASSPVLDATLDDVSATSSDAAPSPDDSASATLDADAGAPDAASCVASGSFGASDGGPFSYGVHYPNGVAAVAYLYGPHGTWGSLTGLAYVDNYYSACGTTDHPANLSALIAAADGPPFTARDANCHLLWALDAGTDDAASSDPELGVPDGAAGSAFHEHSGVAAGGVQAGAPFTVYWFDDNTLASVMSQAYADPTPSGLVPVPDFDRWAIVAGNAAAWHGLPYGAAGNPTSDCCIDTMALNGLYDLATGDFASAVSEWNSLLAMTGSTYDSATQRYLYPSIASNYYFGLFKILTDELRANPAAASSTNPSASDLLQHAVSLDSDILDNQEEQEDSGTLIGWVTNIPAGTSLINTETVASEVLGLGARANSVFEPGVAPLTDDANGYFLRPYHVLSAVASAGSVPGYMTRGPGFRAPPGTYAVDFRLRAPSPTGTVATISILDDVSGAVLATEDVSAAEMATGNLWTEITVNITVTSPCAVLELRTYWSGTGNLDVGPIRVR
jgi:hypothetical protein